MTVLLQRLVVGQLQVNCYIVACEETRKALVIDPGGEGSRILAAVEEHDLDVSKIVLTHFHFDHIMAVEDVRQATKAPVCIHAAEAEHLKRPPLLFRMMLPNAPKDIEADCLLQDGDVLSLGQEQVHVLHTPGHSPGGISLWLPSNGAVICGDLLFRQGVGRTDFPGSSAHELLRSVREKLFSLPDETVVYPGHGPETTIGYEKAHNPWVAIR